MILLATKTKLYLMLKKKTVNVFVLSEEMPPAALKSYPEPILRKRDERYAVFNYGAKRIYFKRLS